MDTTTVNEALQLAKAVITKEPSQQFSVSEVDGAAREAMIALNGGSDKLNLRNFRPGTELFAFVEQLLDITVNEGLKGDEFFMNFVDYRNIAEGDQNIFYTEDKDTFIVSEIGRGNQGIRRQRLGSGEQVSAKTTPKAIRVYEHLSRIMSGRVNFSTFIERVTQSVQKKHYEDIYNLFTSLTVNTPGMYTEAVYSGVYDEQSVLNVIDHVEADNDAPATIFGTRNALRNLKMDVVADAAKDDMYAMGYYGRFNGTPTFRIKPRYKQGTHEFIIPDDQLWVIAGTDKFIKFVTEGQTLLKQVDAVDNYDLTQEYWMIEQYGLILMLTHCLGLITLTK